MAIELKTSIMFTNQREDEIVTRTIENYSNDRITEVGNSAFAFCKSLKYVSLPNVEKIDNNAFTSCSALTNINAPKLKEVGQGGFMATGITKIDFPLIEVIGNTVFSNCTELTSVKLPLVGGIGIQAFANCKKLSILDFPKISSINNFAFNATVLETLILRGSTVCRLNNKNAFNGTPIASGTGYIYVPKDLVESYKTATNWSNFSNQFRAIEDYPDICGEG